MSKVIKIKGMIGGHLHVVFNWTTVQDNMKAWQGQQERIIPLGGLVLGEGSKGGYFMYYGQEHFALTEGQFKTIISFLKEMNDGVQHAPIKKIGAPHPKPNNSPNFATNVWGGAGPDCIAGRLEAA